MWNLVRYMKGRASVESVWAEGAEADVLVYEKRSKRGLEAIT